MQNIPKSLRYWFIAHFLIDMLFAIPLIVAPLYTLTLFGFSGENTLTARLVGAALMGIGLTSLLENKKGRDSYSTLLTLKIIWSIFAEIAILISIMEGAPNTAWLMFAIFVIFTITWIKYRIDLGKK